MIQHIILLLLIPLLLVLQFRARIGPGGWRRFRVGLGWVSGVGAMWLWHEPNLCSLSVSSPGMQLFQTLTLLAGGVLFWQPVWGAEERRLHPAGAVAYLATACFACTILGIYIAFVPLSVCPVFEHVATSSPIFQLVREGWGISAMADQQMGGLMMWVPACTIYLGSILAQVGRWFRAEGELGTSGKVTARYT